jgi:hypothetical protein
MKFTRISFKSARNYVGIYNQSRPLASCAASARKNGRPEKLAGDAKLRQAR